MICLLSSDVLLSGVEPPVHKSLWFDKEKDEITGELAYVFNKKYWECKTKKDWSACPDIYL